MHDDEGEDVARDAHDHDERGAQLQRPPTP